MMHDARFEDGAERPLRLVARDAADLPVISALVQDAVLTGADMRYRRGERRFSMLLNRYRWEDPESAEGRRAERVRAVLDLGDVTAVRHQGALREADMVLSLLSLTYQPETPVEDGPAGPGRVVMTFAGDGLLELQVECLEVTLADVTRPYRAPSGQRPGHPD